MRACMDGASRYGVVTLGNDRVYDFLVALTHSVRRHSSLPLALIPFDDDMKRTAAFARRHGVTIVDNPLLPEIEALGQRIWPGREAAPRSFRKLAAFSGQFEDFLFVDADVVVLRDPAPLLRSHADTARDAMWCFDTNEGAAYKPGPLRDEMVRAGFPGVSAGLFVARRGLLTIDHLRTAVAELEPHREQLQDFADQPVVNYMLQRERIPVGTVADVMPGTAGTTWAKATLRRSDDRWLLDEPGWPWHGGELAALHWAGMSPSPFMPNRRIFLDYRTRGGRLARAAHVARLGLLALGRLPRRARSIVNVVRGRPLGAWR